MFDAAKLETILDTSKFAGHTAKKADRQLSRQTNNKEKGRMTKLKTSAT